MFYPGRKSIKAPSVKRMKVRAFEGGANGIADNLVDISRSKYCFNMTSEDGELKEGFGSSMAEISGDYQPYILPQPDSEIGGMWYYRRYDSELNRRDDRIIFHLSPGRLASLNVGAKSREIVEIAQDVYTVYGAECYRMGDADVLLMSTSDGLLVIDGEAIRRVENAPLIKSLCMHYERAFAIAGREESTIHFSKPLDPTDWSVSAESGGYISLAGSGGRLTKVISFLGYLYVFREYGIERVSARAEQTEFSVRKIYSSTDKIFESTVAVCGDRVMFFSETGLHVFDGASVNALSEVYPAREIGFHGKKFVGVHFKGKYVLACNIDWLRRESTAYERVECTHNNALLIYDLSSGRSEILADHDVAGFVACQSDTGGELLFWLSPESQGYIKTGSLKSGQNLRLGLKTEAYWRTGMTDLGFPERKKLLRSVTVSASGNITVGVLLDGEKTVFEAVSGEGVVLHVNKPFKKMGFFFSTRDRSFRVASPVIRIDVR